MRVKRNNIVAVRVFTGRDLIEKLYSEGWEVEQREYGLLSGVKKLSKGAINAISDLGDNLIVKPISRSKMGKKIIDKTQDSIEDSLDKRIKLDREAENIIEEFHKPADSPGGRDNSKGLWKSVERFFKGKKVVNNEKNASENAIKLLKESGASENELKLAKESLDKSLESYKEEHKMYYKSPFINKLQSFRKNKEK